MLHPKSGKINNTDELLQYSETRLRLLKPHIALCFVYLTNFVVCKQGLKENLLSVMMYVVQNNISRLAMPAIREITEFFYIKFIVFAAIIMSDCM